MNNLKHFAYFLRGLLAFVMDSILPFFHRDKKKWIYSSSSGFRDNPKYLFFQAVEHHPEINSIWIGMSRHDVSYLKFKGYKAYSRNSIKGLYHILTAGVAICDHQLGSFNSFLLGGVYYVNLWHGSSVKKVRWQNTMDFLREYNLKNEAEMRSSFIFKMMQYHVLFRTPDLCLAPSTVQAKEFFAPMMDIPLEHCVVGIFPRSELLLAGKQAAINFIVSKESRETLDFVNGLKQFRKNYIYMPTWRKGNIDFMAASGIEWMTLNECLKNRNELLILKLHPFTKINLDMMSKYSNLMVFPNDSDIYTVLPFIDCLITDYSSIYSDFLMMNKEIILYVFDYDNYVHNSNELGDYDKFFIGKRASDFDQLLHIIDNGEDCHLPQEKYHELMEFFWDNNRHKIDIVEEIKKRIGL